MNITNVVTPFQLLSRDTIFHHNNHMALQAAKKPAEEATNWTL